MVGDVGQDESVGSAARFGGTVPGMAETLDLAPAGGVEDLGDASGQRAVGGGGRAHGARVGGGGEASASGRLDEQDVLRAGVPRRGRRAAGSIEILD